MARKATGSGKGGPPRKGKGRPSSDPLRHALTRASASRTTATRLRWERVAAELAAERAVTARTAPERRAAVKLARSLERDIARTHWITAPKGAPAPFTGTPLKSGVWNIDKGDARYNTAALTDGISATGLDRMRLTITAHVAGIDVRVPDGVARKGSYAIFDYLAGKLHISVSDLLDLGIDYSIEGYEGYRGRQR